MKQKKVLNMNSENNGGAASKNETNNTGTKKAKRTHAEIAADLKSGKKDISAKEVFGALLREVHRGNEHEVSNAIRERLGEERLEDDIEHAEVLSMLGMVEEF